MTLYNEDHTMGEEVEKSEISIIKLSHSWSENILPKLIGTVQKNHLNVLWLCDPMHGNTITTDKGIKTRDFDTIKKEIELFFEIHNKSV